MINKLTNIRLIIVLIAIANTMFLYSVNNYSYIYYILPVYIAVFAFVVVKHNKLKDKNKYFYALHEINQDALERLKGNWNNFKDTGLEFRDENHSFSSDLDIFGQASLFQYINVTTTQMGRKALSRFLTEEPRNKEQINQKQQAISELRNKLAWRQRFMAEGLIRKVKSDNNEALYRFFKTKEEVYTKPWLIVGVRLLPIITIGFILLSIFEKIPYGVSILIFLLQMIIFRFKLEERSEKLNTVYTHANRIKVYAKMLYHLESKNFKSEHLLELKGKLKGESKKTAYQQIELPIEATHIL